MLPSTKGFIPGFTQKQEYLGVPSQWQCVPEACRCSAQALWHCQGRAAAGKLGATGDKLWLVCDALERIWHPPVMLTVKLCFRKNMTPSCHAHSKACVGVPLSNFSRWHLKGWVPAFVICLLLTVIFTQTSILWFLCAAHDDKTVFVYDFLSD